MATMITLPSHAYIPGQTTRHREDAFDALKKTVTYAQNAEQLAQSSAFQAGLQFLDAGFNWEAHEVFEPVWMALPVGSEERRFVQGLIQLANGRLKLRMGKPAATLRLVGLARELLTTDLTQTIMTVEVRHVHQQLDQLALDASIAL